MWASIKPGITYLPSASIVFNVEGRSDFEKEFLISLILSSTIRISLSSILSSEISLPFFISIFIKIIILTKGKKVYTVKTGGRYETCIIDRRKWFYWNKI